MMARYGGHRGRQGKPEGGTAAATELAEAEKPLPQAEVQEETSPQKPSSRLFNPKWGSDKGVFNDTVFATVEGELPPESSQLTRVTFTVFAVKDGKEERLGAQDVHLKDGKATAEVVLWIPQFRDEQGNLPTECEYYFTAKHRDSPEVASEKLAGRQASKPIQDPAVSATTIDVVLLKEGNLPRAEENFVLTDAEGRKFLGVTDKNGRARVENAAPGEATISFPDLRALAANTTHITAGMGGKSSFYLRIQMDPEKARKLEEKFTLSSGDGSFTQVKTVDDDLILGDNFIDLRFTGLPIELAYTLKIEAKGKPPYFIFQDVPFMKLDGFVE